MKLKIHYQTEFDPCLKAMIVSKKKKMPLMMQITCFHIIINMYKLVITFTLNN